MKSLRLLQIQLTNTLAIRRETTGRWGACLPHHKANERTNRVISTSFRMNSWHGNKGDNKDT